MRIYATGHEFPQFQKEGISRKLRKGRRFSEFTTTSVGWRLSQSDPPTEARLIEKEIVEFLLAFK
jgi:hypothetical protein